MCCSPWGHKELDTTERLNLTELMWLLTSWEQGMCSCACTHTRTYTCTHQIISPFNLCLLYLPLKFDTTEATEHEHRQEMRERLMTMS